MLPTDRRLVLLVFRLGSRRYGLVAAGVREVVRAVAIAPLPKAPAIVEGVINYRGAIVPVLDIRSRFGVAAQSLHPSQHFIIATAGTRVVALRVDGVDEVVTVDRDAVAAAVVVPGAEYVAGIARSADGLVVIHDLDAFLSLEEAGRVDGALAATADPARGAEHQ